MLLSGHLFLMVNFIYLATIIYEIWTGFKMNTLTEPLVQKTWEKLSFESC